MTKRHRFRRFAESRRIEEFARVAQPVERHVEGVCVEGSTPSPGTTGEKCVDCKGRGYRKLFRHGKMRCVECEGTGVKPAGPQTQEDLDQLEMDANNVPEFGE